MAKTRRVKFEFNENSLVSLERLKAQGAFVMSDASENTDRELWRERPGDFYADSIHVTESGSIGINVGGRVLVMPLQEWHFAGMKECQKQAERVSGAPEPLPVSGEVDKPSSLPGPSAHRMQYALWRDTTLLGKKSGE